MVVGTDVPYLRNLDPQSHRLSGVLGLNPNPYLAPPQILPLD